MATLMMSGGLFLVGFSTGCLASYRGSGHGTDLWAAKWFGGIGTALLVGGVVLWKGVRG